MTGPPPYSSQQNERLLNREVSSGYGETTLSVVGNDYRIAGTLVFASSAAPEGEMLMADTSAINFFNNTGCRN